MASKRALAVKEKLRRGEIVYSAWLTFNDVGVAEVLAGSGFDIVLIDTEHTSITLENLHHCLAAGIKRVLDIGADGVIGPMTMDAEHCARLVASCKYAPAGRRGFGPRRASDYFRDMSGYIANADAATFVIPQIEHVEAADRALEIASVPGVDALCLGPMDMSATAGLLGQLDHPTMVAAMDKVFDAARAKSLAVCMGFYLPPEQQPKWVAKGARLVIAADDLANLRTGVSRDLAEARRLLAR
jgi:2-keto-3-deoxy-L-rhamnonate aldolase RhmA